MSKRSIITLVVIAAILGIVIGLLVYFKAGSSPQTPDAIASQSNAKALAKDPETETQQPSETPVPTPEESPVDQGEAFSAFAGDARAMFDRAAEAARPTIDEVVRAPVVQRTALGIEVIALCYAIQFASETIIALSRVTGVRMSFALIASLVFYIFRGDPALTGRARRLAEVVSSRGLEFFRTVHPVALRAQCFGQDCLRAPAAALENLQRLISQVLRGLSEYVAETRRSASCIGLDCYRRISQLPDWAQLRGRLSVSITASRGYVSAAVGMLWRFVISLWVFASMRIGLGSFFSAASAEVLTVRRD